MKRLRVSAVVPAAGAGLRFGRKEGRRKLFFVVNRKPILIHTLLALEASGLIDDIIVVVRRGDIGRWRKAIKGFGLKRIKQITAGGRTRAESVKNGLSFVPKESKIVLIHDGVRPVIDKKIIARSINASRRFGAAVCGVPVVPTIKSANKDGTVKSTPDRSSLYSIQTPQVFKKDVILRAYKNALKHPSRITDDSMLVERLGYKVKIISGSHKNIKITTPEDLILAEELLKTKK